jgi:hypothetical protein
MAPAVFGYRAAGPAPGPGRDPHTLGRTRHLSNHATMQRSWLRDFDSTGGHGYTWCAQRGRSSAGEHLLCTQGVAGSSPAVSTTQDYQGLASDTPVSHPPSRQMHRVWSDAQALFLLGRQVANCSPRTVCIYRDNLARFQRDCGIEALQDATPPVIQRYLTRLREGGLRPLSVHQHFRCLRAFLSWCVESGLLAEHPMRGMKMRVPRTLPRVPEDVEVQRACVFR